MMLEAPSRDLKLFTDRGGAHRPKKSCFLLSVASREGSRTVGIFTYREPIRGPTLRRYFKDIVSRDPSWTVYPLMVHEDPPK